VLAVLFVLVPSVGLAQDGNGRRNQQVRAAAVEHADAPTATAVRASGSIAVDGRLDEPAWAEAPVISEFTQLDPFEGEPVTEPTEVRIIYDDNAIYIGAALHDSERPRTRLGRRDAMISATDWFSVSLDSYHDHLTSYRFSVNPSGLRRDMALAGGGNLDPGMEARGGDTSWDPVWDVETTIVPPGADRDPQDPEAFSGWIVEMRIPFSQLRFRPGDEQTWGIQLERQINRKQENSYFAFTPKNEASGIARYGHLHGISGIASGRNLEVVPYVAGRQENRVVAEETEVDFANPFRSPTERFSNAGVDILYRLTSNVTLNATLNPDFGQVEVDPAVINLTAFETRFQERRPFFVDGSELF